MSPDQPIRSYNYYFTAIHEIAFGKEPEKQDMRFVLEDYANSLPEYTANKLIDKVVKRDSWIRSLKDAMEHAIKIDQESRQAEVMRTRRNASSTSINTTANTTMNELDELDVNYMAARQGNSRFNSTMKPDITETAKSTPPRTSSMIPTRPNHGITAKVEVTSMTPNHGTTTRVEVITTTTTGESTNTGTLQENLDKTSVLSMQPTKVTRRS